MKSKDLIDAIDDCIENIDGVAGVLNMAICSNADVQPANQESICCLLFNTLINTKEELNKVVLALSE